MIKSFYFFINGKNLFSKTDKVIGPGCLSKTLPWLSKINVSGIPYKPQFIPVLPDVSDPTLKNGSPNSLRNSKAFF